METIVETETRSKKTICVEDLRRKILTQVLEPGAYLDETELSEAYGISRPPVREVLRQLMGEGYVMLHENRGAQVAPMSHKSLRNFFIAAPMIYAAVAKLAKDPVAFDVSERLAITDVFLIVTAGNERQVGVLMS